MFGFKLWKAKPKKVLAAGGAYLEVYTVDSIVEQKLTIADYLIREAKFLESKAKAMREQAKKLEN